MDTIPYKDLQECPLHAMNEVRRQLDSALPTSSTWYLLEVSMTSAYQVTSKLQIHNLYFITLHTLSPPHMCRLNPE